MSKNIAILSLAGIALLIMAGCSTTEAGSVSSSSATPPTRPASSIPAVTTSPAIAVPVPEVTSAPPVISKEESPALYKIADVIKNAKTLMGKSIIIEGKIVSECGAGCWFTLNDGTGTIYVDLAPSNLTIPQKRGAKAKVFGNVTSEKGETYLIGTKVEFL